MKTMVLRMKCHLSLSILLIFTITPLGINGNEPAQKAAEAIQIAIDTLMNFFQLYHTCVSSKIVYKNFILDNLQAYLFFPAKTTVGYAPKFTTNRKFFANLIGTPEFHHMINKDLGELQLSFVEKLKFCDEIALDEDMLKDLYDKEYSDSSNNVKK